MIQTMTSAHSSPRLPGAEDFRCYPEPTSGCSSQQSQRSAPSEFLYTHDLRRALDKSDFNVRNRSHLLKSLSRDRIDDRHDVEITRVLRHSEHFNGGLDLDLTPLKRTPYYSNSQSFCQRQNTLTPPHRDEDLGVRTGSDVGGTTSGYRGDDGLDADEEDADSVSPPKIAPIGGKILNIIDHAIVKPIPYKPIVVPGPSSSCYGEPTPRRKGSSQNSSLDRFGKAATTTTSHSADDGYASTRDWQNLSSGSSVSQNSFPGSEGNDRRSGKSSCGSDSTAYRKRQNSEHAGISDGGERVCGYERNSGSSCARRRGFSFAQTPSPSDSGVCELEAMLREKELELQVLRNTMERNELAMMQVFEEKQQNWEMGMTDVVDEWQLKLRGHQQKSFRSEQSLLLQIFKLQQDNKNLRLNLEENTQEPHRQPLGNVEEDLRIVRTKMEDLVFEQKRMSTEIEVLKSQLKNAVEDASSKSIELISAQLVLKDNEIEIECKNSEIHRLLTDLNQLKRQLNETNEHKVNLECQLEKFKSYPESRLSSSSSAFDKPDLAESLKVELNMANRELDELRGALERERTQWSEEKTKVINYQKHLQLNYIQMARKNKLLEVEVQQMTSELERHDAQCQRVTMDESFC